MNDTHESAAEVQIALVRQADMIQRFHTLQSLSSAAMQLSRNNLRKLHPHLSEIETDILFVKLHYGEDLAEGLRGSVGKESDLVDSPDLLLALRPVIGAFDELGITYSIGGSVGSSLHGLARTTLDMGLPQ